MAGARLSANWAPQAARPALPRALCCNPAHPHAPGKSLAFNEGRALLRAQRQERQWHPATTAAAASNESASEAEALSSSEARARAVAALAADTFLRNEITIGVGTGLAVNCLLEELAERLRGGKLRAVRVVPASDAAAAEAALHGIPQTSAEEAGRLDFYFEAADELAVDEEGTLAFVVGRRQQPAQPQLHRARALATAATTNVALASEPGVLVPRLGGSLPVALEEETWEETAEELDDIFLGDAELWRRSNEEGAGPRGGDSPYVSPEGHTIVDIRFYEGLKLFGKDADYGSIAREIESVGVVAHGLMANVAAVAVIADGEGEPARLAWRGEAAAAPASSG